MEGEGDREIDYVYQMQSFRTAKLTVFALILCLPGMSFAGVKMPTGASAQPERLDVGSFTLFVNDQRAGREQFSLFRTVATDGVAFELRAESAIGDRRAAVRLETDSAGTPIRYSVEERTGAAMSLRLGGQRVRGRFATLSRSATGESAREYILAPGAMVLENEGLLQYALLIRRPLATIDSTVSVNVLTPIANRQSTAYLTLESMNDTVTIAGSRRVASRWRLRTDSDEVRMIWADTEWRLLRITIPARGLVAIRDDIPRTASLFPI